MNAMHKKVMRWQPLTLSASLLVSFGLTVLIASGCGGDDGAVPPDVSGTFLQDMVSLVSSDCDSTMNGVLDEFVPVEDGSSCTYEIANVPTPDETPTPITLPLPPLAVTAMCPNSSESSVLRGDVDSSGTISANFGRVTSTFPSNCTSGETVKLSVNARRSPATATFTFQFHFSEECLVSPASCTAVLESRWTRRSATQEG